MTSSDFYTIVFILLLGIYIYYLFLFKKNIRNEKSDKVSKSIFVSVIVCVRNEENCIENLLNSLILQDYKNDLSEIPLYEIIIANDQSTDKTESILQKYTEKFPFIRYFNVVNRENVISPKKNALSQAIYMAKGEVLLLTDADCTATKNWISSHISIYEKYPDTEMIAGFSKTRISGAEHHLLNNQELSTSDLIKINNKNFRSLPLYRKFEHFDFLVLMFAAQGALQSGLAFSCSGQNLSYKKKSFYDVDGFSSIKHYISGDDLHLMQKFASYNKKIRFVSDTDSFTVTEPISGWKALLNQRSRWASNMKMMYLTNKKFFLYLISSFVCIGLLPFNNIILYIIKCFFDYRFINHTLALKGLSGVFENNDSAYKSRNYFFTINKTSLMWFLISPIYILTVTVLGIFSLFKWKDRRG